MTWEDKVKKFGSPVDGLTYECKLRHFGTGKEITHDLICVTEDDNSEVDEWNWDIYEWRLK